MRNLSSWQAIAVASQMGFMLAATVAIGVFAGSYLDSMLNTSPVFIILGAVAGLASGLYSCVQIYRFALRNGRSE